MILRWNICLSPRSLNLIPDVTGSQTDPVTEFEIGPGSISIMTLWRASECAI